MLAGRSFREEVKNTEAAQANLSGFECYPYTWQGRHQSGPGAKPGPPGV